MKDPRQRQKIVCNFARIYDTRPRVNSPALSNHATEPAVVNCTTTTDFSGELSEVTPTTMILHSVRQTNFAQFSNERELGHRVASSAKNVGTKVSDQCSRHHASESSKDPS